MAAFSKAAEVAGLNLSRTVGRCARQVVGRSAEDRLDRDSYDFKPNNSVCSDSKNSRNSENSDAQLWIGSILGKIVNKESRDGTPVPTCSDPAQSKASSSWNVVFESKAPFEPKTDASFSEWLTYVDLLSPSTEADTTLVKKIVQMLDAGEEAQLESVTERLSVQDIVHVLSNSRTPTSAFMFYKWLRNRCFYISDLSVYTALMERLFTSRDLETWDQVEVVMRDMIKRKTAIDSQQFGRLLGLVKAGKTSMNSRLQLYIQWLFEMKSLGLIPWFSTYEKVMKLCNRLEMYESTISVFEAIPTNTYCWAYTLALSACRCTGNLTLGEKLLREMRLQNMELDPKCCNDLMTLYANHGHIDKVESFLVEMKEWGVVLNVQLHTTVIHAYGKVGKVKEAEEIFRSIDKGRDAGISRAMAACYRNAGQFNELLALLRQEGSQIGTICFASSFEACVEKGEWKIALEIMKDMQESRISLLPRLYPLILLACSKVNDFSACKAVVFDLKEMGMLSLEELERIIRMYISLENVPCALGALEVMNERGLGPPTADLFECCILAFSKTRLADAMEMYDIMRSVDHTPSFTVFTTLIKAHINAEDMLQSKKLYEEMLMAGFKPEETLASLMLPSCKD